MFPLFRAVAGWNASQYLALQRLYRQAPCAEALEDPDDYRIFDRNLPPAQAPRALSQNTGRSNPKRQKRIPEYLEPDEVNAIIRAAPNPKAKLLMLEQWRAGLRVSEALDLEVRDLSLDTPNPTVRVRSGKGGKSRLVPAHPELHGALSSALAYGDISQGRLIEAHTTTAWRWVKTAVKRAEELGAISPAKRVSTHTLRHSYARHLLMNGIPIN